LICAMPTLWKGLLYDDLALEQAERLISPLNPANLEEVRPAIARDALRARLLDRSLQEWASDVVQIACDSLDRQARKNDNGESEAVHLSRLRAQVAEGRTAADIVRGRVAGATNFRAAVIEAARI
jgi:glutamate--cysteine ligase